MKKTLLFAAFAALAMCLQAQDPAEWTFVAENVEVGSYSEDVTNGIYTFVCNGKTWDVDDNTARFSNDTTVQYTRRIKAKSKNNSIRIAAPSAGTLVFGARTGSNSDVTRTLVATQNGVELYNAIVQEADTMDHVYGETPKAYYTTNVAVPAAGTVEVTMPTGNLNYYFIQFTTEGVDDPTPDNPNPDDPNPEDPTPDPQPTEDNILDPALIGANTFDADYTSGIYTLVVVPGENETKPWVIDTNNAKFDVNSTTVAYTHRMKSGGANNYISVAAPEAGTLLICPRSSNKDDNERTVVVTQGSNELLNVIVADEQAVDKVFPSHVVNIPQAGEVRITNPVNAMNYYYIEFKTSTGVKHVCNLGKLAMNNNVVVATGAKTLYVYNVLGRLVRTANAQELDINDMGRGIYIVKAVYADGKAQTLKVRR